MLVKLDQVIKQFGVLTLQAFRNSRVLTLTLLSLFRRDGNRCALHSLRDANLRRKVSVRTALFPSRQKSHPNSSRKRASPAQTGPGTGFILDSKTTRRVLARSF